MNSSASKDSSKQGAFLRRFLASVAVIIGGIAVSMAAPRAAAAARNRYGRVLFSRERELDTTHAG